MDYSEFDFVILIAETEHKRNECRGFMLYRPGFTPEQHKQVEFKAWQMEHKDAEDRHHALPENAVTFKDDFMTVTMNGKILGATRQAAKCLKVLYDAVNKKESLTNQKLKHRIKSTAKAFNLKHAFKRNDDPEIYKELITASEGDVSSGQKKEYSLNEKYTYFLE